MEACCCWRERELSIMGVVTSEGSATDLLMLFLKRSICLTTEGAHRSQNVRSYLLSRTMESRLLKRFKKEGGHC